MEINTLIPLKRSLKQDARAEQVKARILQDMQAIPNISEYKTNMEFLLHICNSIEFIVKKKDSINKKTLAITIMKNLFSDLTEADSLLLENNIQFLFDNKRIKKISMMLVGTRLLASWVKKKFSL